MKKIEVLEKELNYQLKVYKGKTKRYAELKAELDLYNFLCVIFYLR